MSYLYVAQVSIPKEYESELNRLYDDEHVPNLLKVPGVRGCRRYKLEWGDPEMPSYLALYDLDDPNLPKTDAWNMGPLLTLPRDWQRRAPCATMW